MSFPSIAVGVRGVALVLCLVCCPSAKTFAQGATGLLPKHKVELPPAPPLPNLPLGSLPGPNVEWGIPQAPGVDHYYLDGKPDEWWPNEFLSNPDPNLDVKDLKGYHFPPFLRWVTVEKRIVKAGETIKGEALVEDPSEVLPWGIVFEGPQGRRTTFNFRFRGRKDNPAMFDGELVVPRWTEPGRYLPIDVFMSNSLGHSKGYFPEFHPATRDIALEVLPNPEADVMAPVVEDFAIGRPGKSTIDGVLQSYDIKDPIMVWAKVTDNKSGVRSVTVRMLSPTEKFKELELRPWMGKENYWVGYFKIPSHYEGGEYYTSSVYARDNAGMELYTFYRTDPKLKAARFVVRQDRNIVDSTPPELITTWIDKKEGNLGDPVKVSMIIADDLSGVETVVADFAAYPSFADKRRVHLKRVQPNDVLQKPGFNIEQNLWEGTFTTHKMDEPGDWKLVRIFARDAADNLLDLMRSAHPEMLNISVRLNGGVRNVTAGGPTSASSTASPERATATAPAPTTPAKIRRVDMTPPHPPRGACLNCHEP